MALFNYATREITLKIVYYGPGLSGKTTNIERLHSNLGPDRKGKLLSLSTEADRTLFFDFLPVEIGKVKDFSIRFQLYTVPGQVRYNATRKLVLKGADAVVFVADSQKEMRGANIESLENMKENLISNDLDPEDIPVVFQYNKRDLPDILGMDELNKELNARGYQYFEAVAVEGRGVEETFQAMTKEVLKHIVKKHRVDMDSEGVDAAGTPVEKRSATPLHEDLTAVEEAAVADGFQEETETGWTDIGSEDIEIVGHESADIPIERIPGLQSHSGLTEDRELDEFGQDLPLSEDFSATADAAVAEEDYGSPEPKFEDDSIESIYKAFMSEEGEEIPPVAEMSSLSSVESFEEDKESDALKAFSESIMPSAEKADLDEDGPPSQKDVIFGANSETTNPASAGDKEKASVVAQNIILDEIGALARTLKRINDSITSLKSDMNVLSDKIRDMEKKFEAFSVKTDELNSGIKRSLDSDGEISQNIRKNVEDIKTTMQKAKKRRFWIFFD